MGFDWKKLLGVVAPMAGTALAGPMGGAVASQIVAKLGLTKDGKPVDPANQADFNEAMAQAMLNPEQVLQLKQFEAQHVENMRALGIKSVTDLEKINADDRNSARQREMSVKDKTPTVLAYITVLGTFGIMLAVMAGWTKVDSALAGTFVGYLISESKQVLSYYFGSSAGSAEKTALLAKADAIKD